MPEPEDVEVESSPTEDVETVEEPTGEVTTPEKETPESPETPEPEGVKEEGEVDNRGVPWKNVAMENERKFKDLKDSLPDTIADAISKAIPKQVSETRQYTKDELIDFKNHSTDAGQRAWAEKELEKARSDETKNLFESQRNADKKQAKVDQEKQVALGSVMRKYPLMFNADGTWNNSHPLTAKLSRVYNSREVFKNDGMGLLGAADMAFAEYVLEQQPDLAKATKKLKRQVKTLEKATLIEGSGEPTTPTTKSPGLVARDRIARDGSDKAALKDWAHAYLKSRGKFD